MKKNHSYTLSEAVFTAGITLLLLGTAIPLVSTEQHQAMSEHCKNNLKTCAQAMSAYAKDNRGFYLTYMHDKPTYTKKQSHVTWGYWMSKYKYITNPLDLICPAGDPDGVSGKNNNFQLNTYGIMVNSEFMPYYRASADRNVRAILGAKTTANKTIMLVDSCDDKGKQSYSWNFRFKTGPMAQQRHDDGIHAVDFSGAVKALTASNFAADLAVDCRRTSVKPAAAYYRDSEGKVLNTAIQY